MSTANTPTVDQAQSLRVMFEHFNGALFEGALPAERVLVCWTRAHQVIFGHLAPRRWADELGQPLYELAINANVMQAATLERLCGCMVHEMEHLRMSEAGTAGRPGYHKAEFCDRMRAFGIVSVDARTGQDVPAGSGCASVANRIEPGDTPFRRAFEELPMAAIPPYESEPEQEEKPEGGGNGEGAAGKPEPDAERPKPPRKPGTRAKYTCPGCGLNVWAKGGALLLCVSNTCGGLALIEQVGGAE